MFGWLKRQFSRPRHAAPAPALPVPSGGGFDLIFGPRASGSSALAKPAETVVLIGSCIAETVAMGLSTVPAATKRFNFIPIPLHLKRLDDPNVRQSISTARFVFVQSVAAQHLNLINAVRPGDSEVVMLPDAVLRSVWPFDGDSGYRDAAVDAARPGAPNYDHDGALARLREIEPDPKRRLQRYRDLDIDLAPRIDRVIEVQQRFLDGIDKTNDAHLGRFISQHFRDRQLFYNSTHPSGLLFQEVCAFCWRKLGLPGEAPPISGLDSWRKDSVPVHPLIARRLGLTWASETTRYHCGDFGLMTWEEWAAAYIQRYG